MDLAIGAERRGRGTTVDAAGLTYCCPLELAGIPVLLAGALRDSQPARLILPTDPDIASYLSRMDLVQCLEDHGVAIVGPVAQGERQDLSTSLLELTPIADTDAVEAWNARLFRLVERRSDRRTANQVFLIVGEVLGNALSHGRSPIGAFAAAQYYSGKTSGRPPHLEVAVADGGRGILDHLRTVYPDVTRAHDAIELSLREGVSGIADHSRGHGLDEVEAVGRQLGGRILIRSADGLGLIEFPGRRPRESFVGAPQALPGTWVLIDLNLPHGAPAAADGP